MLLPWLTQSGAPLSPRSLSTLVGPLEQAAMRPVKAVTANNFATASIIFMTFSWNGKTGLRLSH
jgi:hypothetical protein